MATIEVNSTHINFNEYEYLNLQSLLPKLQKEFPFEKYDIKKLALNGQVIEPNSENPLLIRPIEKSDHIIVNFTPVENQLNDLSDDLSQLLDKILVKISVCADLLENDQNDIAQIKLTKIIEAIDIFIQGISYSIKKLDIQNELPQKELQIHLLSVLKAIYNAQTKEDFIVLTDLLEYELKDNLTQWKILILPAIKNTNTEN